MRKLKTVASALVVAAFLLTGSVANANTISLANLGPGVPFGPGSLWSYIYSFGNSYLVQNESYFTINDFGLALEVNPPNQPSPDWVLQPQTLLGRNDVAPLSPGDSGSVLNVTYLWTGATGPVVDSAFFFTLFSPNPTIFGQAVSYTTGDQNSSTPSLGSNGLGRVLAPGVPDGGSTMALLGFAMLAAGALRRKLGR